MMESGKMARAVIALVMAAVMALMAGLAMPAYAKADVVTANNEESVDLSYLPEETAKAVKVFSDLMSEIDYQGTGSGKYQMLTGRLGGLGDGSVNGTAGLYLLGLMSDLDGTSYAGTDETITDLPFLMKEDFKDKLDDVNIMKDQAEKQGDKAQVAMLEKAQGYLAEWDYFGEHTVAPFLDLVSKYKKKVVNEIDTWWHEDHTQGGINVLFTSVQGTVSLTYSSADYNGGVFPDKAENGENVDKNASFGVPGSCLAEITSIDFHEDTYQSDFIDKAAEVISKAADDKTLKASEKFYSSWVSLSTDAKKQTAKTYARGLINTVTFLCSLRTVNTKDEEDKWVEQMITDYENICASFLEEKAILEKRIKVNFISYGFEKEAALYIEKACIFIQTIAGFFGVVTLTVETQYGDIKKDSLKKLRDTWVSSMNYSEKMKSDSKTGHDNFCYSAGGTVDFKRLKVSNTAKAKYDYCYEYYETTSFTSYSADPWKLTDEKGNKPDFSNLLSDGSHRRLYRIYSGNYYTDTMNYGEYLKAYSNVVPENYTGKLITEYKGISDFKLKDDIWMKATVLYGTYFKNGKWYEIVKPDTTLDRDSFVCHDRIAGKYVNMDYDDGELHDGNIAARAAYMEYHWYWRNDEGTVLGQTAEIDVDETKEKYTIKDLLTNRGAYHITDKITQSGTTAMMTITPLPSDEVKKTGPLADTEDYVLPAKDGGEDELADPVPEADWEKAQKRLNLYPENEPAKEKKLDEGIDYEIDVAAVRAKAESVKVQLSASEKKKIAAAMKETLMACQAELKDSGALAYKDAFGLEGSDADELALAKEVFPETLLDENGEPIASADDMTIMNRYEPHVTLRFVSEDGNVKAVISPAFNIDPQIVVWSGDAEEYQAFTVPDGCMADKGRKMTVRIPVKSTADAMTVTVRQYDDNLTKVASYDGALNTDSIDTYAEISADKSGIFELFDGQKVVSIKNKPQPKKTYFKKLKKVKKGIKATWKKVSSISGYQLQYSAKKNFSKKKTVNIKGRSTTSSTVKGLKSGKKYYFRIRTYKIQDGEKYYSAWSRTRSKKYRK